MFGIVLYNPGTGGSHLTNLLNSKVFNNRDLYLNNENNVDQIVELSNIDSHVDYVVKAPHFFHYINYYDKNPALINQAKVFLLELPQKGNRCYERIREIYPAYSGGELLFNDLSNLYSSRILKGANPNVDSFIIDLDSLWDPDPNKIINHLKSTTPVDLDEGYCNFIHTLWCKKVGIT
jgi:hypothetical protein